MGTNQFIEAYETALATQNWSAVSPLIHKDACVIFSNGAKHIGINQIQIAFQHNFDMIKGEAYAVSNVKWIHKSDNFAVYIFDFDWKGIINGKEAGGSGTGSTVLERVGDMWLLLVEHLGPKMSST